MSNADDEPTWCPTCLKERIYTASCEHMGPAPQPAPSADEAKVREILDRTGWFFEVPRDKAQLVGHDEVLGLLHEAYAAGKADAFKECEGIARMLPQTPRVNVARAIADAISRRKNGLK